MIREDYSVLWRERVCGKPSWGSVSRHSLILISGSSLTLAELAELIPSAVTTVFAGQVCSDQGQTRMRRQCEVAGYFEPEKTEFKP